MSNNVSRRRPMAEVLSALNYPTSPDDNRGSAYRIAQQAGLAVGPAAKPVSVGGLSGAAVSGARDAKVFFRVAGGFTFCVAFIDATLSDCRRYLILTLSVTDSELFRIGDGSQVAEFTASVPNMGVEIRTAKNEKSFDFTVKGLRFFVFPVLSIVPVSGPGTVGGQPELAVDSDLDEEPDQDSDEQSQSDDEPGSDTLSDSAILNKQKEYTGDTLHAILFGDQSPRGE